MNKLLLSSLFALAGGNYVEQDMMRMGNYEIVEFDIDLNVDPADNIISLKAFGETYNLYLTVNDGIIGNAILNHKGESGGRGDISELLESCHYHVQFNDGDDKPGYGGISFCPGRGVRGRLVGFNDTLIIRPAKHYLEFDNNPNAWHEITDKHLVYKMSDYDYTDIPLAQGRRIKKTGARDDASHFIKGVSMNNNGNGKGNENGNIKGKNKNKNRKLLSTNNEVALYVIADPSMYDYYQNTYGSSWESQMFSDATDYVNDVSSEYYNTNWGTSIGAIKVLFSKFDALTSFSGDFASLVPTFTGTNTIDGNGYLDLAVTWSTNYINYNEIDNLQLWTKYSFSSGSAGLGWVTTVFPEYNNYVFEAMCSTSGYSSSNNVLNWGYDWGVRTMTHEMGHNFGANHDQETSCGINAGLMGYGTGEGFSDCSISTIDSMFTATGGYQCLTNGGSTIGGTGTGTSTGTGTTGTTVDTPTPAPTPGPTSAPTTMAGCNYYDCVTVYNIGSIEGSFNFVFNGCYGDYASYTSNWYQYIVYLYHSAASGYDYWFINFDNYNDYGGHAYCYNEENPTNCDGSWYYWNGGWYLDTDGTVNGGCSSSMINMGSKYVDGGDNGDDDSDDSDDNDNDYSNSHNYNSNCTNPYGDSICIYNDGNLWDNGIGKFDFYLCKDDIPAFLYHNEGSSSSLSSSYILHYETNRWLLSTNSLSDVSGVAFCNEIILTECTYEKWYIKDLSSNDMMTYINDESMGYDSNCIHDDNDDNDNSENGYCNNDNSCALWNGEFNIEDSTEQTQICKDSYSACISLELSSDYSQVSTKLHCHNDFDIDIKFNVSFFNNENSYQIYNNFLTNYQTIFDTCDESDSNNNSLNVDLVSSNLLICPNCQFTQSSSNSDSSQDSSAHGVLPSTFIILISMVGIYIML